MTSLAILALEIKSKSAKSVMYLLRMFLSKLSMMSFETTISSLAKFISLKPFLAFLSKSEFIRPLVLSFAGTWREM